MDKKVVTAIVTSGRRFSPVWIIPIVSLVAAGWMIYQYVNQQGPEIHLTVATADGIEAGQTLVKARNIKMGIVTDVKLSKDYSQIELTVRMDSGTERMLRTDSEFWMVKPRIGAGGVSGLETLLSGPYIELSPGMSSGTKTRFVLRSEQPIAGPDVKGVRILLMADKAGQLTVGDPVMYEGYVVGRVEKAGFDINRQQASYQLFIFHSIPQFLIQKYRLKCLDKI